MVEARQELAREESVHQVNEVARKQNRRLEDQVRSEVVPLATC